MVELAALLHDIGDHKYSQDPEDDLRQIEVGWGRELADAAVQGWTEAQAHLHHSTAAVLWLA